MRITNNFNFKFEINSRDRYGGSLTLASNQRGEDNIQFEEIPPIGYLFGTVLVLAVFTSTGFYSDRPWIYLGLVLITLGVVVTTSYKMKQKYEADGLIEAVKWAREPIGDISGSESSKSTNIEKTPPAPQKLKNELYFERANKKCEWCGDQIDSPDVHHIKPREEGGPNKKSNLIVLCPTCHRKADRGAISRDKLKYQIRNGD